MADTQTYGFEAEVRQLLDLVIHSLYSQREVFLRELVSNSSDALDRLRVLGLSREDLRTAEGEPGIILRLDAEARTITISDNGIGMTAEEAKDHLGTIARSGTKAFVQALEEGKESGSEGLIGQFGVGFYSALMVADHLVVESLSALPDAEPVRWTCDGSTTYTLGEGSRTERGTDVTLTLREDADEFLDFDRLRAIVRKHSEFIRYPIELDDKQVNEPSALWTRDPKEITEDEYQAFYRHVTGDWGEPAAWLHVRADAPLQYRTVLFFPSRAPHDLNYPDGKRPLKLYAKRVLIEDEAKFLLPEYLRFVRGVVDTEDLELNVSRELVQQTGVVKVLKAQLTSRVLKRFKELANKDSETWLELWGEYGQVLKEGIHSDTDHRDKLVELARFRSTRGDEWVSLADVVEAQADSDDTIWYLTGPDLDTVKRSPHLEAFTRKGIEVLLLTDVVDEWVVQAIGEYRDKPLKSVARGELDLDDVPEPELAEGLVGWIAEVLGDEVKEVRASKRLTDSPSVLVDAQGAMGANMERILEQLGQAFPTSSRILEVNPSHPQLQALAHLHATGETERAAPLARLLLDQALLLEGKVVDPAGLVDRIQALGTLAAGALGVESPVAEEPAAEE